MCCWRIRSHISGKGTRAQGECERNDFFTAPSYKQQSQKAVFECIQEFCISDTDLHRAVKHVYSWHVILNIYPLKDISNHLAPIGMVKLWIFSKI